MSPQEKQELQQYLSAIGKILVKNTPEEQLQNFSSLSERRAAETSHDPLPETL
jgi:DNA-binding IclR family transcriptional regulator